VFHGFGQAKFPDGGSVLGSSQFQHWHAAAASKNDTQSKSGQTWLDKNYLALLI